MKLLRALFLLAIVFSLAIGADLFAQDGGKTDEKQEKPATQKAAAQKKGLEAKAVPAGPGQKEALKKAKVVPKMNENVTAPHSNDIKDGKSKPDDQGKKVDFVDENGDGLNDNVVSDKNGQDFGKGKHRGRGKGKRFLGFIDEDGDGINDYLMYNDEDMMGNKGEKWMSPQECIGPRFGRGGKMKSGFGKMGPEAGKTPGQGGEHGPGRGGHHGGDKGQP